VNWRQSGRNLFGRRALYGDVIINFCSYPPTYGSDNRKGNYLGKGTGYKP
jgi:hypothetical protein